MRNLLFLFLTLTCTTFTLSLHAQLYYAVQPKDAADPNLLVMDITTGMVISSIPVTMGATPIDGYTGMARNPVDGKLYVVIRSGADSKLATLAANGTATFLSDLSDRIAGISFSAAGILYGVSGDGATTPNVIHEINPATGSLSPAAVVPGGADGEAIAFNTNNGLLYRYGGGKILQAVNVSTGMVTFVDSLQNIANWAHAMYFNSVNGDFTFCAGDTAYSLSTAGTVTKISTLSLPDGVKGLVSKPPCSPLTVTTTVDGFTIAADSTADAYQWIDCDNNNAAIAGETAQSFTAAANGNFAVVVTNEVNCTDTSACVAISGVGIAGEPQTSVISVYPNPADHFLNIDLNGIHQPAELTVYDAIGRLKFSADVMPGQTVRLSTIDLASGLYLVHIAAGDADGHHRILVK